MYSFSNPNNTQHDYKTCWILQVIIRINPYTTIPFIIQTFLLILYVLFCVFQAKRDLANVRHNKKSFQFKLLRLNYLLGILTLELVINVLAFVSWNITNTFKNNYIPHRRLSNNCWIHGDKSMLSLHSHIDENLYWVYFLIRVLDAFSLLLMPTITHFIRVLREYYLDRPHTLKPLLYRHLSLMYIRFIIMFVLTNVFNTYMLYKIIQSLLFLYDFGDYLIHRRSLYLVLEGIRNQARRDPIFMKLRDKGIILRNFQRPSIYTGVILSVIVFEIQVSTVFSFVKMLLVNGCYFNYISWGIIPTLTFSRATVGIVFKIGDYVMILSFITGMIHQALMSLAYTIVLLVIAYNWWIKRKYYKRIHLSTKALMDVYRTSYYSIEIKMSASWDKSNSETSLMHELKVSLLEQQKANAMLLHDKETAFMERDLLRQEIVRLFRDGKQDSSIASDIPLPPSLPPPPIPLSSTDIPVNAETGESEVHGLLEKLRLANGGENIREEGTNLVNHLREKAREQKNAMLQAEGERESAVVKLQSTEIDLKAKEGKLLKAIEDLSEENNDMREEFETMKLVYSLKKGLSREDEIRHKYEQQLDSMEKVMDERDNQNRFLLAAVNKARNERDMMLEKYQKLEDRYKRERGHIPVSRNNSSLVRASSISSQPSQRSLPSSSN